MKSGNAKLIKRETSTLYIVNNILRETPSDDKLPDLYNDIIEICNPRKPIFTVEEDLLFIGDSGAIEGACGIEFFETLGCKLGIIYRNDQQRGYSKEVDSSCFELRIYVTPSSEYYQTKIEDVINRYPVRAVHKNA